MGIFAKDPNGKCVYGYKFKWTHEHKTPDDLHPLIFTYDKVASDAADRLDELVPSQPVGFRKDIQETIEPAGKKAHRDLYKLVQDYAESDDIVGKLWNEVNTVPEWVDWNQIERGQKVFWRYGGAGITALTYLSLLGGMGSGRTVETLDRTGGFGAAVVRRRLLETTQHTLGVHKNLKAIQPGGEGFVSSVRVRLLHTSVRKRIMQLAKAKPEYYNLQEYGVPVNDLDCMGTINTFSATLIWMGWPRQGIYLRQQEISDYLALWRYVAYLMGTPHDWLSTPASARTLTESFLVSEIKPTKKSATLARNIITGLEGNAPAYSSRGFQNALARWLNGSELATELGVENPGLWYNILAAGQCLLFVWTSYINRSVTSWDEKNVNFMRNMLYEALVLNKSKGALGHKAKFYFKWVPDLVNTTTPLGETIEANHRNSGITCPGVERGALITLILTGTAFGICLWAGVKVANVANVFGLVDQLRSVAYLIRAKTPLLAYASNLRGQISEA